MQWQKFTQLKQRSVDTISITGSNTFNFPRKFYDDNKLSNFKYVTIYYEKDEKSIGFDFNNRDEDKYNFKIQKNENGFGGFISATSFFKTNDLKIPEIKGRYEWSIQNVPEIGELFVIKLKSNSEITPPFFTSPSPSSSDNTSPEPILSPSSDAPETPIETPMEQKT